MGKTITKNDLEFDNKIILKSVYGKGDLTYYIQTTPDPKTGLYASCVRKVNSAGDMILSEKDRTEYAEGRAVFFPENHIFTIKPGYSGKVYDLNNMKDKSEWECIKHNKLIAKDRNEKDANGNFVIDGVRPTKNNPGRNGIAELYIDRPGLDTIQRVSRKKMIHQAESFILNDQKGYDGQLNMALILGKDMSNQPAADVVDYLLRVADKNPEKIIQLYTRGDTYLRLLFISARKKNIIRIKNKLYLYGDDIVLGATDDAVITWMKNPDNKKTLELIQKETFPDYFPDK